MPYWWWIVPAVAGLLALIALTDALTSLLRRRPYRAIGDIFGGGALLAIAAVLLLLGLDIQTYSRLTYEQPVATLALRQTGPRSVYDLRSVGDNGRLTLLSTRLHQSRLVDTLCGSATLMPMADGAQYALSVTQTGLVARPANSQAAQAVDGWK